MTEHFVTESRTLRTHHEFNKTLISGVRCLTKKVTRENNLVCVYIIIFHIA